LGRLGGRRENRRICAASPAAARPLYPAGAAPKSMVACCTAASEACKGTAAAGNEIRRRTGFDWPAKG